MGEMVSVFQAATDVLERDVIAWVDSGLAGESVLFAVGIALVGLCSIAVGLGNVADPEMYDDPTDVFVYLLGWVLLWGLTPAYVAFGILEYGPLVATAITVGIFVVAGFALVPLAEWAHELRGRRRIEQHSSSIYTTESTEGSN